MNRQNVFNISKIAGVILGVVAMLYAGLSVHRLFVETVHAPPFEAALSAGTLVGVMAFLLITVWSTEHMGIKGLAGLLLLGFAGAAAVLVGLEATFRGGILSVPPEVAEVGRVVAALLPALVLIPTLTLLPVSRADPDAHASGAAAFGHYAGVGMKGAAILASSVAAAYFGVSRGMPPFVAVFAGVLLEGAFIWCILQAVGAKQSGDRFDRGVWLTLATLFGLFIAAVAVQSFSSITGIHVPIVAALGDAGASLYVSAVGLAIALTIIAQILTRRIDVRADVIDAPPPGGRGQALRKPVAHRLAGGIRTQREAWGDVRQALRGDYPQPPATGGQQVAGRALAPGCRARVTEPTRQLAADTIGSDAADATITPAPRRQAEPASQTADKPPAAGGKLPAGDDPHPEGAGAGADGAARDPKRRK
jgi:hypothetical protein